MNRQIIVFIGFLFIIVPAVITAVLLQKLGFTSNTAAVMFTGWVMVPYLVMGYIMGWHSKSVRAAILNCIAVCIVSAGGLYMVVDVMLINQDAQGGLAVLIVPILQVGAFGLIKGILSFFKS